MKLLLDHNLSHRLLPDLEPHFPGSSHVRLHGLERADDTAVWDFARGGGFVIVTHDADFHERSVLLGFPPKVVWLRCGNTSTENLRHLLLANRATIDAFAADPTTACLEILG